ncbi:MAG: 50S ribosomal protein L32 [Clostridiales bacterium]|jgi:large subunit ribosomal protein L32|nr:50S ribosomal protein L32 [Clostridiales bacterium]
MSICPKGKISKARRDKRRANSFVIPAISLVKCAKCGELVRAHAACKVCGTYKKQTVLTIKEK